MLLPSRPGAAVSAAVAPGRPDLGLMLPYTPLHHLLCRDADGPLVMTSGNRSDEPMAASDDEARVCLAGIADAFLVHDRRIATRCDDSVVRVLAGAPSFVRRSRGWAPGPIRLAFPVAEPVLATGGHLKNTFCIARGDAAYVSHHIGDLEGVDAFLALREGIDRHTRLLGVAPDIVAYDLHPDYLSTKLALELPAAQRIAVQHHYAHVVACAAEHGVADPVLGVAFDGTGLGTDGAVWGGEFLVADAVGFERVAHLDYVPLPGGEAAIRHPLRMAASYLFAAFGEDMASLDIAFVDRLPPGEWPVLRSMLRRGVQSPPTSSVGRLFDAVSALLGVQTRARYEGEAAMALEAAADPAIERAYAFEVRETADGWIAEPASVLRAIVADMVADRAVPDMAAAFHNALRDLIVDVAVRVRRRNGIRRVALTGGVFQNRLLVERVAAALSSRGFEVLLHRQVPCNDGGLALGQACIAAAVAGGSVGGRAVRSRAVRAAPTAVVTGHR